MDKFIKQVKNMTKEKIWSFYSITFLFIGIFSYGQSISGKISFKDGKNISYAEIIATKNEVRQTTISDENGNFSLKLSENGSYLLNILQDGNNVYNKTIVVDEDIYKNFIIDNLNLGKEVSIQEITLVAKKKLIEQKVDRLVFNVENSIASQGMSGLDALRNTPLVRVQNDNVSIVGKGGVSIMVNDRMLNLSGSELTNYLQSLRSEDIARIEVITTPPSKYEAQGNSGIINIVLKKNPNLGFSGTVSGAYQRNSYDGFRTGATLNYQSKKISTSIKVRQYDYSYKLEGTRNLLGLNNSIYTSETRKDQAKAVGINFSLDYKINNKHNIGFIYDYNNSRYNISANGTSLYKHQIVIDSTLYTNQRQTWKTPTHTLNTYYDIKLDSLGKKLSFTGNFLSNNPDKENDFNTVNNISANEDVVRNNSKMNYSIYSGQADLILPYKWATIETGAKYTLFDNNSNVGYYNLTELGYIINPDNSNIFNYKENNFSTYISLQKDFNEKWSAKAGLRYEYTSLEGQTQGIGAATVSNKYGKLFPTAYVSFKPNDDHTFSLNYSKRINRPDFQSLNPFRWYTNTYMYYTGTPTLKPSFNDNVEFSYSYKGKLTIGLYNQYSQDNTSSIARLEGGIYSNVIENGYNQNRTGLNIGFYNTFFKIWETSISLNGSYTRTAPITYELEKLKVYSLFYSINNTMALNKNKTYFMLVNFSHSLPFTYANMKLEDQIDFSPGIKASFFEKNLNLSVVVSDLFKTLKNNGYSYNGGYKSEFKQYNDYRRFTLSASYSFGNKKIKGANKNVKFDEQNRAN